MNEIREYSKNHCWQYDIRVNNLHEDLKQINLSENEMKSLRIKDFDFAFEEKELVYESVKTFIERHEWLGKISLYPTHIFTARYNGILAGVVVMDMPAAFSKALGENTKTLERLISRGACISWSPKNLASKLIAFSMKWMVKNTQYRYFTAYSDSEARELGTIYQACNFYYLGKKFGAKKQFLLPHNKWVSDRYFRSRSVYKKLAKEAGIIWDDTWSKGDKVYFDKMPENTVKKIKQLSKLFQESCECRQLEPKRKYGYVLGANKRETKQLRKLFESRNKTYPYPKDR